MRFQVTQVMDAIEQRLTTDVTLAQAVVDLGQVVRNVELDQGRPVNLVRIGMVIDALSRHLVDGGAMLYGVVDRPLLSESALTSKERMVLGRWADDGLIEVVPVIGDRVLEIADMTGLPVITASPQQHRSGIGVRPYEDLAGRYGWLTNGTGRVLNLCPRSGVAVLSPLPAPTADGTPDSAVPVIGRAKVPEWVRPAPEKNQPAPAEPAVNESDAAQPGTAEPVVAEADTQTDAEPEAADAGSDAEADTTTEQEPDASPETTTPAEAAGEAEPEARPAAEARPEAEARTEDGAPPATDAEAPADADTDIDTETETEVQAEAAAQPAATSGADAAPGTDGPAEAVAPEQADTATDPATAETGSDAGAPEGGLPLPAVVFASRGVLPVVRTRISWRRFRAAEPNQAHTALLGRQWRCDEFECPVFGEYRRIGQPVPRLRAGAPVCPRHDVPVVDIGPREPSYPISIVVDDMPRRRLVVRGSRPLSFGSAAGDPDDPDLVSVAPWLHSAAAAWISPRHLRLAVSDGGLVVTDTSENGTVVWLRTGPDSQRTTKVLRGESYRLGEWDSVELYTGIELMRGDRRLAAVLGRSELADGLASVLLDAPTAAHHQVSA